VYNTYTGQVVSSTDENAKTTNYAYADPGHMNRITSVTRPDSVQTTYSYDDTQRIVTTRSPIQGNDQLVQTAFYDGLDRPIKTRIADASSATYSTVESQYDPIGRAYRTSNPHNSVAQYWTETRLDALGRTTRAILPDSQQTTYTYSGTSTTVTDPTGKQRKSTGD